MGILDYLLAGLGPEARKELAKDAAERAVKSAGDAVYDKVDKVREDFESAARARRDKRDREEAEREAAAEVKRDAEAVEDELAALKRKLGKD